MLFALQEDLGFRVTAYVVPDSGGKTPSIRLLNEGEELLKVSADQVIPALIAAGRHATGQCGFLLDEVRVPGLSTMAGLELLEEETGLLVYRRPPPECLDGLRIFRLETHLLPLWRLDDAIKGRFQLWYKGIERYGRETSTQVFCSNEGKSSYVSGRLLYKNYEYYLRRGIKAVALIRDPYDELAERLLILKNIGNRAEIILGARDTISLAPVMEALSDFNDFSLESCRALFKKASKPMMDALSNPLVRQLTTSTPDEMPGRSAIAVALEVLASFELVGLRSDADHFNGALEELLGLDEFSLPSLAEHSRISEFSQQLRVLPVIEGLLEQDLELFQVVLSAFKTVAA